MDNCQHIAHILWSYTVGKVSLSQAKTMVTLIKLTKKVIKAGLGLFGKIPF
jgi:hypothetical protein